MRVFLVQHGEAVPEEVDRSRPLSQRGREQVKRMAEFLARADLVVSTICHSGKLRARQTAELLASYVVPSEGIVERGDLNPNDPVEPVVQTLGQGLKDVMIVGHLPFLGRLASATLLGSRADILAFRPGSVVCLESDDGSRWRLAWMVTPEIVR